MTAGCWICGGATGPSPALAALGFEECRECGFVFHPARDVAETRTVYEGGAYEKRRFAIDYAAADTVDERRRNARTRLTWLREHVGRGRLLDVGAAGGAFVLEAREAGFDAFGVEPAPAFARHAREVLGVDVRDGRVEDLDLPGGSLDAVTMWHVLEHMPEPRGTLELLARALRPEGALVVEVPNLAAVAARRMGLQWTHLDADVHVSQFTPATLNALLSAVGLAVTDMHTVAHGVYLTPRERWTPAHVAHRAKLARHGAIGLRDRHRHEFLRAVARRAR
jgi:2-polyprenyl-3-methyl-5-hydroxy-6-metoxy-1,4-benzoquinol methylase